MNCISPVRASLFLLLTATMLGGCSWFHHRDDYYSKAAETRPLEVPPDLDTPVSSNELVVPAAGAGGNSSVPATAPPAGVTVTTAPAASSTVASGSGLRVADSVGHTWQRVGLALERAQVGTISARDEAAHSYSVDVAGLAVAAAPAPAEEHHWYSRILHPFGGGKSSPKAGAPVSGSVSIRVSADGDAARVDVQGAAGDASSDEAARRVLAVLRERLS